MTRIIFGQNLFAAFRNDRDFVWFEARHAASVIPHRAREDGRVDHAARCCAAHHAAAVEDRADDPRQPPTDATAASGSTGQGVEERLLYDRLADVDEELADALFQGVEEVTERQLPFGSLLGKHLESVRPGFRETVVHFLGGRQILRREFVRGILKLGLDQLQLLDCQIGTGATHRFPESNGLVDCAGERVVYGLQFPAGGEDASFIVPVLGQLQAFEDQRPLFHEAVDFGLGVLLIPKLPSQPGDLVTALLGQFKTSLLSRQFFFADCLGDLGFTRRLALHRNLELQFRDPLSIALIVFLSGFRTITIQFGKTLVRSHLGLCDLHFLSSPLNDLTSSLAFKDALVSIDLTGTKKL